MGDILVTYCILTFDINHAGHCLCLNNYSVTYFHVEIQEDRRVKKITLDLACRRTIIDSIAFITNLLPAK